MINYDLIGDVAWKSKLPPVKWLVMRNDDTSN